MSTVPFPVLGHSNNVWDILGHFWDISGQVLGHEIAFLGTFWDISVHQQNKHPLNLAMVRNPLWRARGQTKPTNLARYVHVMYDHFRTF